MSLINQVLLDLEKRHAAESELKPLPPYVRAVPGPVRSGLWTIVLAVVGAIAIVAAAVMLFLYRTDLVPPVSAPQSVAVPLAIKPPEPDPVPVPKQPVAEPPAQTVAFAPVSRLSDQLSLMPLPSLRNEKPSAAERNAKPGLEKAPAKAAIPARKMSVDDAVTSLPATRAPDASVKEPIALDVPVRPEAPVKPEKIQPDVASKTPARVQPEAPAQAEMPLKAEASPGPRAPGVESAELPQPIPKSDVPGAIDKQMREIVPAERAEIAFRRGVSQIQEGRANAAEIEFRNALKLDPSHSGAVQALLGLLLDTGRNADAEQVLRKALDLNPRQPRYAMVLARLEIERGEISTAVNTMVGVLPYVQSDPDFYAFLAALLQREGRHREAVDYYRAALRTIPGNGVWMMGLGISLRASNQVAEARDAFERSLASKQLSSELQDFVERQLREMSLKKKK